MTQQGENINSAMLTSARTLWPVGANLVSPEAVPKLLLDGEKCDIWTDDAGLTLEEDALLRIDDSGLFIVWKSDKKDQSVIDCLQVTDIRPGTSPKDADIAWQLELKGGGSVNYRTFCICVGMDFVSQSYVYVAVYDENKCKKWMDALRSVVHSEWIRLTSHASPMWKLYKLWLRLRLRTDAFNRLLSKTVSRALGSQSSNTTDKFICEVMQECGIVLTNFHSSIPSASSSSSLTSPTPIITSSASTFQYGSSTITNNNFSYTSLSSVPQLTQASVSAQISAIEDSVVDPESFTFERFFALFQKVCPRPDIQSIFLMVCSKDPPLSIQTSNAMNYTPPNNLTNCSCNVEQLTLYLNSYQRDPRHNEILHPLRLSKQVAEQVIKTYEPDDAVRSRGQLSYSGFLRYILSESDPIKADMLIASQDMDQPLTHYYISTSHNTYLIGRQFGGKSMVDMYRLILLSGCRSVELDCWDGNNGEPIITHGKAMCTDISYKDVLIAIKETAFLTSPFPVTLSFENHCSRQQQYKLAKYAEDIFGESLLREPLTGYPLEPGVPLPSPNQLLYKIIIKNKRLRAEVEKRQLELFRQGKLRPDDNTFEADGDSCATDITEVSRKLSPSLVVNGNSNSKSENRKSVTGKAAINQMIVSGDDAALLELSNDRSETAIATANPPEANKAGDRDAQSSSSSSTIKYSAASALSKVMANRKNAISGLSPAEEAALLANYHYTGATVNVHPYLSAMVNYTQPIKFQGFDVAEVRSVHYHMSSFNENVGLVLIKELAIDFVNYNKRQLSRIYPKGSRYDSSNFNPQVFWSAGCQMVALNFQTPDLAMQLNQGRFDYNGRSGYLLKPEFLRRSDRNNFNPFSEAPVDGVIAATCTVQILSAQFLSVDRKVGSYVEVDMFGLPGDTIRKEFKTRLVQSNGVNPVYVPAVNGDPLPGAYVFRKVVLPDLAVLRLAVYDETGRLLGQRILPLDGLQAGYRHVCLRSEGSCPLPSATLFCRFCLDTYVPDGVGNFVDLLAAPLKEKPAENRNDQLRHLHHKFTTSMDSEHVNANGGGIPSESANSSPLDSASANAVTSAPRKPTEATQTDEEILADTMSTVERLQADSKVFQKLLQKQQRELEKLKKRQNGEKLDLANKHYKALPSKTSSRKVKHSKSGDNLIRLRSASAIGGGCAVSLAESARTSTSAALETQAREYAELMQKCLRDERDCQIKQAGARIELVKKLLSTHQDTQIRQRSHQHDREYKDLELQQARQMKESVSVVSDDKSISRQEKERKIRELKESNIKRFCEERKRLKNAQERTREELLRFHSKQKSLIDSKLQEEIREIENAYEEERLGATRPQILV